MLPVPTYRRPAAGKKSVGQRAGKASIWRAGDLFDRRVHATAITTSWWTPAVRILRQHIASCSVSIPNSSISSRFLLIHTSDLAAYSNLCGRMINGEPRVSKFGTINQTRANCTLSVNTWTLQRMIHCTRCARWIKYRHRTLAAGTFSTIKFLFPRCP